MSTNAQPQPPKNANTRNNMARTQLNQQKTLENASLPRKKIDKYCWTHGGSGHTSITCRAKAPGHQDNATFENRLGVLNAYCTQNTWKRGQVENRDNIVAKIHNPKSTCSPSIYTTIIAEGDSGASHHYFRTEDAHILQNVQDTIGPTIQQPDNSILWSQGSGQVPLTNKLSNAAQHALILPNLNSASLLSLGQIWNDGCTVVLAKKN